MEQKLTTASQTLFKLTSIEMRVKEPLISSSAPLPGNSGSHSTPTAQYGSVEDKAAQLKAKILENKRSSSRASMVDKTESSSTGANEKKAPAITQPMAKKQSGVESMINANQEAALRSDIAVVYGSEREQQGSTDRTALSRNDIRQRVVADVVDSAPALQYPSNKNPAEPRGSLEAITRKNSLEGLENNSHLVGDVRRQHRAATSSPREPSELWPLKEPELNRNRRNEDKDDTGISDAANSGIMQRVLQMPDDNGQQMVVATANSSPSLPGNAAAYSHYFDDLDEWLELTGYHNREYREKVLLREERRRQLQAELDTLDQDEEQNDRRLPSVRMPPPPVPAMTIGSRASNIARSRTVSASAATGAKRNLSVDEERPAKQPRVERGQTSARLIGEDLKPAQELFGTKLARIERYVLAYDIY